MQAKTIRGNFIVINCSTSDEGNLEKMLFGSEDRDGFPVMERWKS